MRKYLIKLSYDHPRQIEMDIEGKRKDRRYVLRKRLMKTFSQMLILKTKISKHQLCLYVNPSQEYVIQFLNEAFEV